MLKFSILTWLCALSLCYATNDRYLCKDVFVMKDAENSSVAIPYKVMDAHNLTDHPDFKQIQVCTTREENSQNLSKPETELCQDRKEEKVSCSFFTIMTFATLMCLSLLLNVILFIKSSRHLVKRLMTA